MMTSCSSPQTTAVTLLPPSTDHSREYTPLLVYGKHVKEGVDLGVRKSFADIGQTISDYLGLGAHFEAESFLKDILK